jgi:hypothetical protein
MSDRPVHIPKNFLSKEIDDVFGGTIKEKRELEQYFWTSKVVKKLLDATQYIVVSQHPV